MQTQQDSETRPEVETDVPEPATVATWSPASEPEVSEPGAIATGLPEAEETPVDQPADKSIDGDDVPDPLDEAERRSEEAWDRAGEAVEDLRNAGRETDEPEKT